MFLKLFDLAAKPLLEGLGATSQGWLDNLFAFGPAEMPGGQAVLFQKCRDEVLVDDRRIEIVTTQAVVTRNREGSDVESRAGRTRLDPAKEHVAGAATKIENEHGLGRGNEVDLGVGE